ncbi:MAG: hypothetical protein P8J59_01220, partial [Phycisphaerales bacterium]|nr:hypothetical protein [Phycisphaerales bacterium]
MRFLSTGNRYLGGKEKKKSLTRKGRLDPGSRRPMATRNRFFRSAPATPTMWLADQPNHLLRDHEFDT